MTDAGAERYDTLHIRIDRDGAGEYRTLAMGPDGHTARGSFRVPLTDTELNDFVTKVGLVRRARSGPEDRMVAIEATGSALFDALFSDQIGDAYTAARAAAFDGDRGLRISLAFSGAPELLRFPWELLYSRRRFLASSRETPVVRTLDVDSKVRPYPLRLPLRVLGIVSAPVGYPELDGDREKENLEKAVAPLQRDGLVELIWLKRATLEELSSRISEPDEIHVIHFIGHGAYDEATEAGILVLERSDGKADEVGGRRLGTMLEDERSLRLVVLNSCEGARTSVVDPFSGTATSLLGYDIPAVIGMQFEITDVAAIAFSNALYRALAQGMPIDAAVAPARRAIMAVREAEFGTPVLFLRADDARLFDIEVPAARAEATAEVPIAADAAVIDPTDAPPVTVAGAPEATTPEPQPEPEPVAAEADAPSSSPADLRGQDRVEDRLAEFESRQPAQAVSTPGTPRMPADWRGHRSDAWVDHGTEITVRLELTHEHELVITELAKQKQVAVDFDGRRIAMGKYLHELVRFADGNALRTCTLLANSAFEHYYQGDFSACYVDGIEIDLGDDDSPRRSSDFPASLFSRRTGVHDPALARARVEYTKPAGGQYKGIATIVLTFEREYRIRILTDRLGHHLEINGMFKRPGFRRDVAEFSVGDRRGFHKCAVNVTQLRDPEWSTVPFVLSLVIDDAQVLIEQGDVRPS